MTSSFRIATGLSGLVFVLAACTATSGDPGGTSSGSSGSSGEVDPDCTCNISQNGVTKMLACGESACISGSPYECGAHAEITRGGTACAAPAKDSGVDAPPPAPAATTIPCPYSGPDFGEATDTCDTKTEYCILAKNGGSSAMCAPLPPNCHACACANSNADAAWRAGNNNTANCGTSTLGTATLTCTETSGAITVVCK